MSTLVAIRPRSAGAALRFPLPAAFGRRAHLPREVVWVAIAAIAAFMLLGQIDTLAASIDVAVGANPLLVALGVGLVSLRYAMAAVSLQAAIPVRLAFRPTLAVQLASAFVGRFTPEGIGWLVLNQRYLERAGVGRTTGLAGISVKVLVAAVTRLLIAGAVVVLAAGGVDFRWSMPALPSVPPALGAVAAVLLVATGMLALRARPSGGQRMLRALADLRVVLRDPRRMVVLIAASASLTILSALTLAASTTAVGGQVPFAALFAVYLAGTAIAAASPTPGNIGAVEVALSAGLTSLGMAPASALAAVLVYRLLTFWLPVIPGFLALRHLRGSGTL